MLDVAFGGPERLLLHHVHEVSDWVITLDRKLGIEYFDHGGRPDRPDYLIDHTPDTLVPADRRLMVTSRSVHELTAFFRPVLADYGLPAADAHTQALLTHLRSLSGGVSLKLLSAQTQRSEAIGLALARAYLGHLGAFRNQLVVPLDDHLDLYERRPKDGDTLGLKRTDLALFHLDRRERCITCRLVEVKCYRRVGDAEAWSKLRDKIVGQIGESEAALARHFDPAFARPDRALKTRQFAHLLEFYLRRAERYGLIGPAAAAEARGLRLVSEGLPVVAGLSEEGGL